MWRTDRRKMGADDLSDSKQIKEQANERLGIRWR
jgi:hypothetical protein